MNKKSHLLNEEIDLTESLKIIWVKKIIVLFITIVSILIAIGYEIYKKKELNIYSYSYKLDFNQFENTDFIKILSLNNNFNNTNNKNLNFRKSFLNKFLEEIKDYEELSSVIKKNINTKDRTDESVFAHQTYGQLVNSPNKDIIDFTKNEFHILVKVKWYDDIEILNILDETIELAILNLRNKLMNELSVYLHNYKNNLILKDENEIQYLLEQSYIARQLNIKDNAVDNTLDKESFYLRGYLAIDEKINSIQNRKYKKIYSAINEINLIKKSNINLVDHNLVLLNKKLIEKNSNFKLNLIISIITGLLIGVIFVISLDLFQSKKINNKKKS